MSTSQPTSQNLVAAMRILAEHIGMSADSRRQIGLLLGYLEPEPPPPADPRDVELAELRARVAGREPVNPSPVGVPAVKPRKPRVSRKKA